MKPFTGIRYGLIPFIRRDGANDHRVLFGSVKTISGSWLIGRYHIVLRRKERTWTGIVAILRSGRTRKILLFNTPGLLWYTTSLYLSLGNAYCFAKLKLELVGISPNIARSSHGGCHLGELLQSIRYSYSLTVCYWNYGCLMVYRPLHGMLGRLSGS